MLGVGALTYGYFHRYRGLSRYSALGLALATTIYPAIVFLATSTLMSEPVFMCLQLGAIVLVERCVREGETGAPLKWAALGGAVAAIAFLTRPAGVGLLGIMLTLPAMQGPFTMALERLLAYFQ